MQYEDEYEHSISMKYSLHMNEYWMVLSSIIYSQQKPFYSVRSSSDKGSIKLDPWNEKRVFSSRWNIFIKLSEGCNLPDLSVLWEKSSSILILTHTHLGSTRFYIHTSRHYIKSGLFELTCIFLQKNKTALWLPVFCFLSNQVEVPCWISVWSLPIVMVLQNQIVQYRWTV